MSGSLQVLASFVVGGGLATLLREIRRLVTTHSRSRSERVLAAASDIQAALDRCVEQTGCQRAMVLKAHNGGRALSVGGDMYSSVLFESTRDDVEPLKPTRVRRLLDLEYIDLLHRTVKFGTCVNWKGDLQIGSRLHDTFTATGALCSIWTLVDEVTRPWWALWLEDRLEVRYLSVVFDHERLDDPVVREELAGLTDRVRNAFASIRE